MKISSLLEILLILIIIAFAASKPIDSESRAIKNVRKQVTATKQEPAPVVIQPVVVATTPSDDDAVDDILGLVVGDDDDDDDDDEEEAVADADDDDDDDVDILGLGDDDDDDDEPEGESAADPADDSDDDDFALLGDDLFDGIFEDDTTTKKPKVKPAPSTAAPPAPVVAIPEKPTKITKPVAPPKDTKKPIEVIQKPIISNIVPPSETGQKIALNLQHTPALLQLSQTTNPNRIPDVKVKPIDKPADDTILIGLKPEQEIPDKVVVIEVPEGSGQQAIMSEHPEIMNAAVPIKNLENQPNNQLNSEESAEDENMIIISSSEIHTQSDVEQQQASEESTDLENEVNTIKDTIQEEAEESSDAKDKVQDAPVAENLEVLERSTAATVVKKPPKKEDEGLLGGIVSAFIDDDDDDEDEKPVANKISPSGQEEGSQEEESDEDDDDEDEKETADEEEEDEDEDEDEESDEPNKKKKKKDEQVAGEISAETDTNKKPTNKTKKKKTDDLSFSSIGETLGLSRIFRAQRS